MIDSDVMIVAININVNQEFENGNNTYTKGSNNDLVYIVDIPFELFDHLTLNGTTLELNTQYKVESGSTKVTIFASYLETLAAGNYSFSIYFTDGTIITDNFTIKNAIDNTLIKLSTPNNLSFVNGTASWNNVSNSLYYIANLYKDNSLMTSVIAFNNSYDFNNDINKYGYGDYQFNVMAVGDYINYLTSNISTMSSVYRYSTNNYGMFPIIILQNSRITSTANEGGTISPLGILQVLSGHSLTFKIIPDDGYEIKDVIVNNVSVGAVSSYTFNNINGQYTIHAIFDEITVVGESVIEVTNEVDETEWINPFVDVDADDVYYGAVRFVYENELFKGISKTEFAPDVTLTRAMFVTVLGRMYGVDVTEYTSSSFDDVDIDEWYGSYVEWAVEHGLVYGYGDGIFGPTDMITYEHVYLIMERFSKLLDIEIDENIIKISDDLSNDATRWEVAMVIYNIYNTIY